MLIQINRSRNTTIVIMSSELDELNGYATGLRSWYRERSSRSCPRMHPMWILPWLCPVKKVCHMSSYKLKPPQIIISLFLLLLVIMAASMQMDLIGFFNQSIVKLVMNGVLVLSLIPMLNVGAGMNFGLPVGIVGGLLGMCLAVNFRLTGIHGFAWLCCSACCSACCWLDLRPDT